MQKITKNARVTTNLCVHQFFHEQKKKSGAKSLSVRCNPESSRTIFTSKKMRKICKKHVPGIWMSIKIAQKSCIFHAKSSSCSPWKITTFELSRYTDGAKKVTKNRSFLTSRFFFFYVQNRYFHRSRYIDAAQEAFIFYWKFIIFYTKIIVFSMKNQCFHTSP